MAEEGDNHKKAHRERLAGRKAEKKKLKNPHVQDLTARQRNPKAFTFSSIVKARTQFTRTQDIKGKKHHIPVVDRTPLEPPPIIVAVVGGPQCGKSTLIRGLIRNFCRQKLSEIEGPVTIVAGKKRRVTFLEVNSDINCLIDVAKVCDVALLLIDATFGIEMEVLEFLEICKTHGSPKIMGILNHLDMFKDGKSLRHKKKLLKHRFQVELYPGAKLFHLSGILNDGYMKTELLNLGRFISTMKFRPIDFRASHPYMLADRIEDISNPETVRQHPELHRKIVLYGYVRGVPFQKSQKVHIPGCGDYAIDNISFLPDPCPLPGALKKRSLNTKERIMYAPMSGVAGVIFDKDGTYIDDRGNNEKKRKFMDEDLQGEKSLDIVRKSQKTNDEKLQAKEISLFTHSETWTAGTLEDDMSDSDEEDTEGDRQNMNFESVTDDNGVVRRRVIFNDNMEDIEGDSDNDTDDDSENENCSKSGLSNVVSYDQRFPSSEGEKRSGENSEQQHRNEMVLAASRAFHSSESFISQLRKMTYGDLIKDESDEDGVDDETGGIFRKKLDIKCKMSQFSKAIVVAVDSSRIESPRISDWSTKEYLETIKDCFVTGEWDAAESAEKLLQLDAEDKDLYGDFEDFETGEHFKSKEDESEEEDPPEESKEKPPAKPEKKSAIEKRTEKKLRMKQMFDAEYDDKTGDNFEATKAELSQQAELNRMVFEDLDEQTRIQYEGYRPGLYVRMEFTLPCEFFQNFDTSYPIIVGGLLDNEQSEGYVKVRIKVHRWYPKVLKSRDPLVVSLGWRRFQTVMQYARRADDWRLIALKYAKPFIHVNADFWGPVSKTSSGFVAFQNITDRVPHFRIAAGGVVLETDKTSQITKKVKLIGYPERLSGKAAFIKDMFHSDLEVVKFVGSQIKTQSGIRGIIRKAFRYDGTFRTKFEDKIKMSDTIILTSWKAVEVPKYYSCLRNMLMDHIEKTCWQGMRTVAQLKRDQKIKISPNPDHLYTKVTERRQYVARPLRISKRLQAALPYTSKPKFTPASKKIKRVIVVKDPKEVKMDEFMLKLRVMMKDKMERDRTERLVKAKKFREQIEEREYYRQKREKKTKARMCRFASMGKGGKEKH